MKKSTRILSVILALTMLLGTFSVMGSAYQAYKGSAITSAQGYNDVDKPTFTTEQYASMALDELDKLLAKSNIKLTADQLFNISDQGLDLTSINNALSSVSALWGSVSGLLPLLGSAADLNINAIYVGHSGSTVITRGASGNTTDFNVLCAVVTFLYDNTGILTSYVNGTLSLGILNSIIADYLFDVRELAQKGLYKLQDLDSDYNVLTDDLPADAETNIDQALADVVTYALFGDHKLVNGSYVLTKEDGYDGLIWDFMEDLPTATITKVINDCNIVNSSASAYDYLETLMIDAFNYIAVPELNNVTRPWLRETCGVTYDKDKMAADPTYDGEYEEGDLDPQLAAIFNVDGMYIPEYDPDDYTGGTFVYNFNAYLGTAMECVLNGKAGEDWTWNTDNYDQHLLENIVSVARWVLEESGDQFFEAYITLPTATEIAAMTDQQVLALVLRTIINESVSWIYIEDSNETAADVCYAACEQLAWQDIPQYTYTKPSRSTYSTDQEYYAALVDQMLDILLDVAVYNLNADMDMVVGSNGKYGNRTATSPASATGTGLLEYEHDYKVLAIEIATWAVHNYASFVTSAGCTLDAIQLDPNGNGTVGSVTINDLWEDIDLIVNSIIPISTTLSGTNVWLDSTVASETNSDGGSDVIRSILFDYIIYPVLGISDLSQTQLILNKNTSGTLATKSVKGALVELVTNIVNLIFPGAVTSTYATLDSLVQNSELATIIGNLISSLNTNKVYWLETALPIVCDVLDLTEEQSFDEMESYLPEVITTSDLSAGIQFQVYNGCSGLNTGFTSESGSFTQDALYEYVITGVDASVTTASGSTSLGVAGIAAGNTLGGGDSKTVTLTGSASNNQLVTFTVRYRVKDEAGNYLASGTELACTKYAYVDTTDKDDSEVRSDTAFGSYTLKSAPAIYANKGTSLDDIAGYSVAIADDSGSSSAVTLRISSVSGVSWLAVNPDASQVSESGSGTFTFSPFVVADGYARLSENYNTANVTSKNFATYGSTDEDATARATTIYTKNADGVSYTAVPASAEFDNTATYYVLNTNVDHTTSGVKYDKEGNILVEDGVYTATFTAAAGSNTTTGTVKIFLYNDFGLESLYNNAVTANRQLSDFTSANAEYNTYTAALLAAGKKVLDPKVNTAFSASTYTSDCQSLYTALYQAIDALDEKSATSGVDGLISAIAGYIVDPDSGNDTHYANNYYLTDGANASYLADNNEAEKAGWNNVQYWATTAGSNSRYAYTYFGKRDYVPQDYYKFRDAKNNAQDLIDSQNVYPPVEPENPGSSASAYEYNKYLEEMETYNTEYAEYQVKVASIPALSPVKVAYALSMVNLTGSRLITYSGDNSKLVAVRANFVPKDASGNEITTQGNYSSSTWSEYVTAKTFADYTIALGTQARPSQLTEALSQYVRAYKRLCEGIDYSNLDAAIANAEDSLSLTETTDAAEVIAALGDTYTAESAQALADAFTEAVSLRAEDLGKSTANEEKVANAAAALNAAVAGLVEATSAEPVIAFHSADDEDYEEALGGSVFYRDDYCATYLPYEEDQYESLLEGVQLVAGLGVAYDACEPTDAFGTLENCYAVWTPNENAMGSTASYITIYTDDSETTEIATYYVIVYGDFNGDGNIDTGDGDDIINYGAEYMWDGQADHFAMGCAGDIDADFDASTMDADVTSDVALALKTVNQDYDNHWGGNGAEDIA